MLCGMTEREIYDRFGDWPFLILCFVIAWVIVWVENNPDPIKDAAARAIRAIGRLFK